MGRSAYWRLVVGRAWKSAWRDSPWSTPLKVVCGLGGVIVVFFLLRSINHQWSWATLLPPLVLIAIVLLALFVYVVRAAADLYGEQRAEIDRLNGLLSTYQPAAPDLPLLDAAKWIAAQLSPDALTYEREWAAVQQVRTAAHDGRLTVWGRPYNYGSLHVEIPSSWWTVGQIEFRTLNASPPGVDTKRVVRHDPPQYFDLKVRQVEIEREWPASPKP